MGNVGRCGDESASTKEQRGEPVAGRPGTGVSNWQCKFEDKDSQKGSLSHLSTLLWWASQTVMDVTGRPRTLVNRLFAGGSFDSKIYPQSVFDRETKDLEEWTEIKCKTHTFDHEAPQGLEEPKWRRIVNPKTCEVLESRPFCEDMLKEDEYIAVRPGTGETYDIQTTVWFGKAKGPKKKKFRKK